MATSGVYIEHNPDGGITIGVTDYNVEAFGGSDWEWSATFSRSDSISLELHLQNEFGEGISLEEMLKKKFGDNFSTLAFKEYCSSLMLNFVERRD